MTQTDGQYAIIVGGEDMIGESLYTFHTKDGNKIAWAWFRNDADAEEWIKLHYPIEYERGIEMRCHVTR